MSLKHRDGGWSLGDDSLEYVIPHLRFAIKEGHGAEVALAFVPFTPAAAAAAAAPRMPRGRIRGQ
jgi:hypothetical protein